MLLLATGAGLAVASLYYSRPMLGVLGADVGASNRAVGRGYTFGLLFQQLSALGAGW